MKRLIRSTMFVGTDENGTPALKVESTPNWGGYLRIDDEKLDVRWMRSSRSFRWADVTWVGWREPVEPSPGDRIAFVLDLAVSLLLRDPIYAGISGTRSATLTVGLRAGAPGTHGQHESQYRTVFPGIDAEAARRSEHP
jgi:hypothetical protein